MPVETDDDRLGIDHDVTVSKIVSNRLSQEVPSFSALTLDVFKEPHSLLVASRVMEAIPAMLAVFDNDLNYIYANNTYVETVNSEKPSWIGLSLTEYLPAYLHEHILPRISRAAKGERISYYLNIVPADGIPREILVTYEPFFAEDGESGFFLMSGLDVTDLKQAEKRLYQAQRLETLGQLTGGIAHDFNNQLGIVVNALELLERKTPSEEQQELIDLCNKGLENCTALTSQLLSFGRQQSLQPDAISVASELSAIRALLRVSLPDNIVLETDFSTEEFRIYVDRAQFESMMLNLVFNARDAMPTGGTITISLSFVNRRDEKWEEAASRGAEFILIDVTDTGTGMTPEVADRVFEPFFTTKPLGGGTGMGLAMVHGFVKQSGGHIKIVTGLGVGTSVRVYFPRSERAAHHRKNATLAPPRSGLRQSVLIVEDEPVLSALLCQMIESLGHKAKSCDNADTAMNLLRSGKFDVVLTDILIRGAVGGLELRRWIIKNFPNVRVLCTSGYQDPRSRHNLSANTDIEFLPKPLRLSTLENALNASAA